MKKEKISRLLLPLLGSQKLIDQWWAEPNKTFGGKTPTEMYAIDYHVVVNYILARYAK
ncbi:hypothetical protein UFOVP961_78 [uncultured Caudovirales phage]|uniref:Uncharacterized protein n=1 Tax=uncultured Caudovirales phage TaxID=2100421 RepID=A0A6J5PX87_9CAUD|nr:hypothetical protein UFOVP961_78 [uncultured Caudovirales phage]CAB4185064.1 hypothetical protein UFOVP1123_6 [uncultured Caudovirales phage]CAB4192986.1 hypothetical protein UFOVP1239_3 [uncultured Caudovirales phage]CAB4215769.1 hypothetical protein UFOVP1484_10 [uncultured Caudovirales phage]CAB5230553.1 hypothetical protein UFOVP1577_16 [uncultured Caudovirales phage]